MVNVLVFKFNRPLGITKSASKAIEITGAKVYDLLRNGGQSKSGYMFDYPLDGLDYRVLQSKKDVQ